MIRSRCWHWRTARKRQQSGFTLIEVLIAGVVLSGVMAAVGKLTVAAIAASRIQSERTRIEAVVTENIQLIQKADSEFRFDAIDSIDQPLPIHDCSNPARALKTYIEKRSKENTETARKLNLRSPDITRSLKEGETNKTLVISYSFEAPETNITKEYRVLEINPNFQARCP